MNEESTDTRITDYVFGELSQTDTAAFERELNASDELQAEVAEMRKAISAVQTELAAESEGLSDASRVKVQQAIESPLTQYADHAPPTNRKLWVTTAIAACLLLITGIGLLRPATKYAREASSQRESSEHESIRSSVDQHANKSADDSYEIAEPLSETLDELTMKHDAHPFGSISKKTENSPMAIDTERSEQQKRQREQLAQAVKDAPAPIPKPTSPSLANNLEKESMRRSLKAKYSGALASPQSSSTAPPNGASTPRPINDQQPFPLDAKRRSDVLGGDHPRDPSLGLGPGWGGDQHDPIEDNPFREVTANPLSTFSIDVDTASYAKVRMYLMQQNRWPRPDAVRIEELVNYFTYDYPSPSQDDEHPFSAAMEVAECPWNPKHRLARIGVQGRELETDRPASNLVFLLDVSGSMNRSNKLPLVVEGMKMLVDQLTENDSVAIVVYAGAAGVVLDPTTGDKKQTIIESLDRLRAGGSTNGGQGIQLAYSLARDHFIAGGTNRVILCSDGDFNVGVTGTDQLVRIAEENAKGNIFLTVLGFGMGNHNDAMMEQISNKGNGNYAFIDSKSEARKVLVDQIGSTLVTIAKDVKIQVEFNPKEVAAYRLIGYENRILAAQDFNDDKKDAGEIGAGHSVTALYELVPADGESDVTVPPVDDLRYQEQAKPNDRADSGELLTLKLRYKQPEGTQSTLIKFPVRDQGKSFVDADHDFRFAASVAAFGMLLRNSPHKGSATFANVHEIATGAASGDKTGYRSEFLQMVKRAATIAGE